MPPGEIIREPEKRGMRTQEHVYTKDFQAKNDGHVTWYTAQGLNVFYRLIAMAKGNSVRSNFWGI